MKNYNYLTTTKNRTWVFKVYSTEEAHANVGSVPKLSSIEVRYDTSNAEEMTRRKDDEATVVAKRRGLVVRQRLSIGEAQRMGTTTLQ